MKRVFFCAALLLLALTGCNKPAAKTDQVKLTVSEKGLYEIYAGALATAGFDLTAVQTDRLALTMGGEPVAFEMLGQGRDAVMRFYGQPAAPGAYTPENIYWLSARGAPALALGDQTATPSAAQAPQTIISDTLRIEEDRLYHGQGGTGASTEVRWYWETLFAPAQTEHTFITPHPGPGPAQMRIFVLGNSSAPVDPDHRLRVSLNGSVLAEAAWDGVGTHEIVVEVPAGLLTTGENRLNLMAPGDTGAPADAVLLDRIELSYPRRLVLESNLAITVDAGVYALQLEGAAAKRPQDIILWDVTDPRSPVRLTDFTRTGDVMHFAVAGQSRRIVAGVTGALHTPAALAAPAANSLPEWPGGADLIIVTVPQFREALKPLVAAREAQGLRVAVLDVGAIDDAFAFGRRGPDSIRALVRYASANWTAPAPRYLLLAGDASYDPLDRLQGAEADLVPSRSVHTTFSGWSASDVWFALPDDAPAARPILAVGRFPAQTVAQLTAMIDKTLAYEKTTPGANWRDNVVLVADNDEPGFAAESADFASRLGRYQSEQNTISENDSATRSRLLSAFAEGAGLIGYFGHGSITLWAQEKILTVEDATALTNRDKLPLVFTVTCLTGFFEHPKTASLAEALLRNPTGGAVAALVPSSAAVLSDQRLLAQALADALEGKKQAEPRRLGDLVREAQVAVPEGGPGVVDILLTFNLLGDPSLLTSF